MHGSLQAVPEREREELFHEAQKEKAGKEKEERRQEKKRRTSAFRELLERTPGIKVCFACPSICGSRGCLVLAFFGQRLRSRVQTLTVVRECAGPRFYAAHRLFLT